MGCESSAELHAYTKMCLEWRSGFSQNGYLGCGLHTCLVALCTSASLCCLYSCTGTVRQEIRIFRGFTDEFAKMRVWFTHNTAQ